MNAAPPRFGDPLFRAFSGRSGPTYAACLLALLLWSIGALAFGRFASPANLSDIFSGYAFVAIAALGAAAVILSGSIDLSIGSCAALAMVAWGMLVGRGLHPVPAGAACVAAGALAGAAMGLFSHALRIPAFLVTLAGMFAMRALAFALRDQSFPVEHPFLDAVASSWRFRFGGMTVSARAMLALLLAAGMWVVLSRTPFGRRLRAVGGRESSARMMGVNVGAARAGAHALCSACAALAGVVLAFEKRSADPGAAVGLELMAIAAAVIGGTRLAGGVGGAPAACVGVLTLGIIRLLIDYHGALSAAWTDIASGALLLACVVFQRAARRSDRRLPDGV